MFWRCQGEGKGFLQGNRRNLLRRLASINRKVFRSFKGQLICVTLTYPGGYPDDPEVCKSHLKALQKRLKRRYGEFAAFWRMGIQKRGAWHLHLLLFVPRSFGRIDTVRHFISSSWYEICGEVSEVHLRVETRVEQIRKWKKATSYAERYLAKGRNFRKGWRRAGSRVYGTRVCFPSSGKWSRSASGMPTRSGESSGSWRRGKVPGAYAG